MIAKFNSLLRNGVREGSQLDIFIREFKQNKLAVAGLVITLGYVVVGVLAPYIAPYDPAAIDVVNQYQPPSLSHPFGTDSFGRDIFSRVVHGTRISLRVATLSISFATVAGVMLGLTAGYYGGNVDEVIMRIMDVLFAFPGILLALVIIAALGPGLNKAIAALAIVYTPIMARIARGSALSVREEEYVMAAESYGESTLGIMFRDMLPNMIAAVMVQATISFAFSILAEAGLSFLGLGAQPPTPSWGILISLGQSSIEKAPWVSFFPGLAIMTTVMGLNFLGDGLRDALDPKTGGDESSEERGRV
jgi:ABC-type dipeptide/oligopeptide/nickel transport system permease subunit